MTIVVADTTCGLPRDLLKARGIPLIPQVVIFGEKSYHDDHEIDTATFLQKLKASPALPKRGTWITSARRPTGPGSSESSCSSACSAPPRDCSP